MVVDVQEMDADFYVFSGHKIFAPTGIGALYGKAELLEEMPPWQGGGNMISDVTFEKTSYQRPPAKFEAGTGNIADAVGLGTALEYLSRLGRPSIERYEHDLLQYATARDPQRSRSSPCRHGAGKGQRPDLRAGRLPSRRGGRSTGSGGNRGTGWSSLRATNPAPLRPGIGCPAFAGDVQHLRRGRPLGRRVAQARRKRRQPPAAHAVRCRPEGRSLRELDVVA